MTDHKCKQCFPNGTVTVTMRCLNLFMTDLSTFPCKSIIKVNVVLNILKVNFLRYCKKLQAALHSIYIV